MKDVKVKFFKIIRGSDYTFNPGNVASIPANLAEAWAKTGICKVITAKANPEVEEVEDESQEDENEFDEKDADVKDVKPEPKPEDKRKGKLKL